MHDVTSASAHWLMIIAFILLAPVARFAQVPLSLAGLRVLERRAPKFKNLSNLEILMTAMAHLIRQSIFARFSDHFHRFRKC